MFSPFIKHLREILLPSPSHPSVTIPTTIYNWYSFTSSSFSCLPDTKAEPAPPIHLGSNVLRLRCPSVCKWANWHVFDPPFRCYWVFIPLLSRRGKENRVACFRAGKEGGLSFNHPEQLQGRKKLSYTCIALLLRMWRGGPVLGLGMRGLSLKVQRYYLGELIQYSYIGINNGMVIESF